MRLIRQSDDFVSSGTEPMLTSESDPSNNSSLVSDTAAIIMSVGLDVIALVGIVGNSLVIAAVIVSCKLRTATNVFVIALSITDLLTCLTLPFQTVALTSENGWPLPDWLCAGIGGITSICFGAGIVLLMFIAIHRFCVITLPATSWRYFYKPRNLAIMVLVAYLYPIAMFAIIPIAGVGKLGYADMYKLCAWDYNDPDSEINDQIVMATLAAALVVIIACYARIYVFVRNYNRTGFPSQRRLGADIGATITNNTAGVTGRVLTSQVSRTSLTMFDNANSQSTLGRRTTSGSKRGANRYEIDITKNLFCVICSFFICITPYGICLAMTEGNVFSIYTGIFLMLNVCINPFIYSFKHPSFRPVIGCLICCRYSDIPKPSPTFKKFLRASLRGT